MNPTQALVLGGGGASGAYSVGVTQALSQGCSPSTDYKPIDPGILTGTSIGAFIASFLVSARQKTDWPNAVADLEAMWLEEMTAFRGRRGAYRLRLNPLDFVHPHNWRQPLTPFRRLIEDLGALGRHGLQRVRRMTSGQKPMAERMMDLMDGHVFFAVDNWNRILRETIDYASLQKAEQALRITATRWQEGTLKVFENADMDSENGPQAIRASCTVPGFFAPTQVADHYYIDGSMRLYAPVSPAVQAGGREIHLVYMNVNVDTAQVDGLENSMEALFRALVIYWLADVEREVERVRAYNQTLALLSVRASKGDLDSSLASLFDGADAIKNGFGPIDDHQPITLHRYFPRSTPYDGTLSFTSVERSRMEAMIEQGIDETRSHDCEACGCVLP